jgi:hypothetical protein
MKDLKTEKSKYLCRLCPEQVGEDQWCEGCASFICKHCDDQQFLPVEHEPEDHWGDSLEHLE